MNLPYLLRLLLHIIRFPIVRHDRLWWRCGTEPSAPTFLGHEEPIMKLLKDYGYPVVYDIGAHAGTWAVRMASRGSIVVAFEPMEKARKTLLQNIKLNKLTTSQIIVIPCALSYENAPISMSDEFGSMTASHRLIPATLVPCHTLDSFADFLFAPNLIKIDVEGNETSVLQGAIRIINTYKPDLLIETHGATSRLLVESFLEALHYTIIHHHWNGQTYIFATWTD